MSIDCCKSYVGKQIIGLLPSGGASPVAPKCLYYGNTFVQSSGWSQFIADIDNTYFPSTSEIYDIGRSIQTTYQPFAGGFSQDGLGSNIYLWSLENDPITSTWQVLNNDDSNFYLVDMILLTCDVTKTCFSVDIPVGGGILFDFVLNGEAPFSNLSVNPSGLNTDSISFPNFLQSIFGGQANITVVDNGSSCYIEIDGCYNAIYPKNINVNGVVYNFTQC